MKNGLNHSTHAGYLDLFQKMSETLKGPEGTSNDVIEPDTFWQLIEKLLLHSSSDDRARARHNLSLSALCKGQALPPLPRKNTSKEQNSVNSRKPRRNEKVTNAVACPNSSRRDASSLVTVPTKRTNVTKNKKPEKISESKEENDIKNDKDKSLKQSENVNPMKTRSVCSLGDLQTQLVKDNNVPASQRLWRYAMRKKPKPTNASVQEDNVIHKVRSNETIYQCLKARLNDAEKETIAIEKKQTQSKPVNAAQKFPPIRHNGLTAHNGSTGNRPACQSKATNGSLSSASNKTNKSANAEPKHPAEEMTINDILQLKPWPVIKQDVEERKALYDNLMKKRFTCGCQLESMSKELMGKGNPRSVLNSDTAKKYNELKSDYLKLCYQESNLRHQIALLHAEIYMMQNKSYHKVPAAVKTITLDSKTTPLHSKSDVCYVEHYPQPPDDGPFFPPLKPPRPLLSIRTERERGNVKRAEKKKQKACSEAKAVELTQDVLEDDVEEFLPEQLSQTSVCSLYSLSPMMTPPLKHEPSQTKTIKENDSLIKLMHRLPKLKSTDRFCDNKLNKY